MKKAKWAILIILPIVLILAAMHSAWAPGKAGVDLFDPFVDPTASGTKYFVKLTIYYIGLDKDTLVPYFPDTTQGESTCWDTEDPTKPRNIASDAPTQMLFYATAERGNEVFFYSSESPTILCLLRDETKQTEEVQKFGNELVNSIFNLDPVGVPPAYAVKSISHFVDATAIDENVVVGRDQFNNTTDLGFMMADLVLAIR
jgi:hypothetical protein